MSNYSDDGNASCWGSIGNCLGPAESPVETATMSSAEGISK